MKTLLSLWLLAKRSKINWLRAEIISSKIIRGGTDSVMMINKNDHDIVLQEYEEINMLDIKDVEDLVRAQMSISEFLERNVPILASLMEVAVNEAMNNGFFSCGRVNVKTKRIGGKLIIRVKDNCQGFNTEKVNLQLKKEIYEDEFEEMLEAEGGRGILLMKLICDKVVYNSRGNEVLLMKRI